MKKFISVIIVLCFFLTSETENYFVYAESASLPTPGTMVNLSPAFEPVLMKGIKVHPENPFLFDFIIDTGDGFPHPDDFRHHPERSEGSQQEQLKSEARKLIKYFLASLTVPEKDLWVNLSPYEKYRMVNSNLGQTVMGRDMLAQDYILKQLTASLIYPEKNLGKTFWDEVYAKAREMYGTSQVPVNTFNKVWIVADKADVFEHGNVAYVVAAHLKVMLEEDYLALSRHSERSEKSHSIVSQITRRIILPQIEKEVNTGRNFAPLRQIFCSMILASWYKMALKDAILTQIYGNKSKVKVGINQDDPKANEAIFNRYLQAYKKGVFNYIRGDVEQRSKQSIPRKYFSGGEQVWGKLNHAMIVHSIPEGINFPDHAVIVEVNTFFQRVGQDRAMTTGHPGISVTPFPVGDDVVFMDGDRLALDDKGKELVSALGSKENVHVIKKLQGWRNSAQYTNYREIFERLLPLYEAMDTTEFVRKWNGLLLEGTVVSPDDFSSHHRPLLIRKIRFSEFLSRIAKKTGYLEEFMYDVDQWKKEPLGIQNCRVMLYVMVSKYLKLKIPVVSKSNDRPEVEKQVSSQKLAQKMKSSEEIYYLPYQKEALKKDGLNLDDKQVAQPGPTPGQINIFFGDMYSVYSFSSEERFMRFYEILKDKYDTATERLVSQVFPPAGRLANTGQDGDKEQMFITRHIKPYLEFIMSMEGAPKEKISSKPRVIIESKRLLQLLSVIRMSEGVDLPYRRESLMGVGFFVPAPGSPESRMGSHGHINMRLPKLAPSLSSKYIYVMNNERQTFTWPVETFLRSFVRIMQQKVSMAEEIYEAMNKQFPLPPSAAMISVLPDVFSITRNEEKRSQFKPSNGGIDFNRVQMNVRKEGQGVRMKFDQAMIERIKREGFDGLDFKIESITPVIDFPSLLGIKVSQEHVQLTGI